MKKLLKRALIVAVASAMAALPFAGCGNSPSGGGTSGGGESSGGGDAAPASGNAKEVSVWHYFEHEADALNKIVEAYNQEQDKIHITATFISRNELMQQYTVGAVSGELPDIGMVDSPDMASYIALGVFEDVTTQLEAWGQLDKFYPGPLSSCRDSDGKLYGLPNNSNCLALLCNMDILNAAGVSKPTTWDELEAACKATTNPADSVYGLAICAVSNEEGTFQFIPWLYSAGASVYKLDTPEAVRAMDFLAGLVSNGYMSKEVVNWGQGDAYNAFCAGKAAMLESGTWQIATLKDDVGDKFKYEYTLLPKDKEYASVIGGENFGVCTGSEATEECVDFLTYMMTAENNADWCEIAGKIPVRSDAAELKDFWTADPLYAVFTEGMNYAVARGPHPEWPTISKALYSAEQSALLGEKTAEEAMKQAAEAVHPILEETPMAAAA